MDREMAFLGHNWTAWFEEVLRLEPFGSNTGDHFLAFGRLEIGFPKAEIRLFAFRRTRPALRVREGLASLFGLIALALILWFQPTLTISRLYPLPELFTTNTAKKD
jgi:hypothetical protein